MQDTGKEYKTRTKKQKIGTKEGSSEKERGKKKVQQDGFVMRTFHNNVNSEHVPLHHNPTLDRVQDMGAGKE